MNKADIIAMQKEIGTDPDGFWGPKSIVACQRFLRSLMPKPNPWPKTDQASLAAFYGKPGDESQLVSMPAPVAMYYNGSRVRTIRCHRKVSTSLVIALAEAYAFAPEVIQIYDGCYNNRLMRAGNLPSLHARGAAIDFDGDRNGNLVSWPVASKMPFSVMKAFAKHGWISAGAFWGRDAMHFQATR